MIPTNALHLKAHLAIFSIVKVNATHTTTHLHLNALTLAELFIGSVATCSSTDLMTLIGTKMELACGPKARQTVINARLIITMAKAK